MKNTTASTADSNIIRASKQGENGTFREFARDQLAWVTGALLLWILVLVVLYPLRVTGDIPVYMDTGERVLDGQRPYIDFFDINPPTIHFLNAIPAAVSRATGLYTLLAYNLMIVGLLGWTVGTVGYLIKRASHEHLIRDLPQWLMPALVVFGSYVSWLLLSFGQRDHIFILSLITWSVARWYRWEGGNPPVALAVVAGAIGATGASLKPTFALAFVLVELFGLLRYRRWRMLLTWDVFGAAIIVGLHVLYFALQPDVLRTYFSEIGPSVIAGYKSYGYTPAVDLIFGGVLPVVVLGFAALLSLHGLRLRGAKGSLSVLMAIMAVSAVLSYALQTKGWRYHALPMLIMAIVIVGLLANAVFADIPARRIRRLASLTRLMPIVVVCVCTLVSFLFVPYFTFGEERMQEREAYLDYSKSGDTVVAVDMDVRGAYSAFYQSGLKSVASFPIAYPLAFAYSAAESTSNSIYEADHTPPAIARLYLDRLMVDIRDKEPQLVLLRTGRNDSFPQFMDAARYVKVHTDIELLLDQDYDSMGIRYPYEVYVRKPGH